VEGIAIKVFQIRQFILTLTVCFWVETASIGARNWARSGIWRQMGSQVLTKVLTGAAVLLMGLVGCHAPGNSPNGAQGEVSLINTIELTSSAFTAGGAIPVEQSCDGKNLSPDLAWSGIPADTKSLVLIVEDPDAPLKPFTHWVLYDLPPKVRQLPAGLPPQPFLPMGGGHGKNDFRRYGYGGACPPRGSTHRYFFKVYALDTLLDLSAGATKAEVLEAMTGHVKATGELMGKYSRQK
jgi:Raf kinase inhibitor-like YbhB/YbcL family protein